MRRYTRVPRRVHVCLLFKVLGETHFMVEPLPQELETAECAVNTRFTL